MLGASENRDEAGSQGRSRGSAEEERPDEEAAVEPARSRKWLVIGGGIGLLVLLLVGIGIAIWPLFTPPPKRWGTRHDITSISSRPLGSEQATEGSQASAGGTPQAEIEALRKENAELQAQIETLRKVQAQARTYVPPAQPSSPSSSVSGETTVGSSDPTAAAMSLKEAIEAMNASTGDFRKKPAK